MPWWGWLIVGFVVWIVVSKLRGLFRQGVPANLDDGMAQFKEMMQKNEVLQQLGNKLGMKSLLEDKLGVQAPAAMPPLPGAVAPIRPAADKPREKRKSRDEQAAEVRSEELRTQGVVARQSDNSAELLDAWRRGAYARAEEVARRIVWEEETSSGGLKSEATRLALLLLGTRAYRAGAHLEARAFMIASTEDPTALDKETAGVLEARGGKIGKMLAERWRSLQAAG